MADSSNKKRHVRYIGLCGELAGRKETLPQLLRLGLRSLSVAPPLVPQVKDLVRSLRISARPPPVPV